MAGGKQESYWLSVKYATHLVSAFIWIEMTAPAGYSIIQSTGGVETNA